MSIWACGDNEWAQLGTGAKSHVQMNFVLASVFKPVASQVIVSAAHTIAVYPDGSAEGVGGDIYGALCDGSKAEVRLTPVKLQLPTFAHISVVEAHGACVLPDGSGRTWGSNMEGTIGNGLWSEGKEHAEPPGCYDTAQTPVFPEPLAVVAGGKYHALAVSTTGAVIAWGENQHGQIGDGTHGGPKLVPTKAGNLSSPAVAIAGGGGHSLALLKDGHVSAWGNGANGQLGHPVTGNLVKPSLVPGVAEIKAIAAGGKFSLFLTKSGTVLETGIFGGTGVQSTPRVVGLPGAATAIAAGRNHAIAIVNGEVFTWGENEWGQLGNGSTRYTTRTTPASTGLHASWIAGGEYNTVALA